jgi:hypothetical protein
MSEEKDLKKEGEELAKVAVESKMGARQLRTIYISAKTKPLPMVEAFIQRQIARVSGTKALEMILDLMKKHEGDKTAFLRVLMYANMLYDYYERQTAMKYRVVAEECAKKVCEQHGCRFVGLDIGTDRGQTLLTVNVSGYRGDLKLLSPSIWQCLVHKDPNFLGRIWIEPVDRR